MGYMNLYWNLPGGWEIRPTRKRRVQEKISQRTDQDTQGNETPPKFD
jgi:hypothetical protein